MATPTTPCRSRRARSQRRAAVTVEMAVILPLLVALVLGTIDVGQYVNVAQTVSTASREAARLAARHGTANVSDVENAVSAYLADCFPSVSQATFDSAITVGVNDAGGNPVTTGDLTGLPIGSALTVDVVLPFDTVRWVQALPFLSNESLASTTTVRRE